MNNLIRFIRGLFQKVDPSATGLLPDKPEVLETLPSHELFVGGTELVSSWRRFAPPFRNQGSSMWCTAFAGTAIASIFERFEHGEKVELSPLELFYRSGGQLNGNYLIATARAMRDGLVLESDVPTPMPNSWGTAEYLKYKGYSLAAKDELERGKRYAVRSEAIVGNNWKSMKAALGHSPLMIAIGLGKTYWDEIAANPTKISAYHAVVVTEMAEDASGKPLWIEIFDRLSYRAGFDGFHKLSPDYAIDLALSFIDLPSNWVEIQEEVKQEAFGNTLSHYGKKRVLELEQKAAKIMTEGLKPHPTLKALFGANWTVCTNAMAYGDYTLTDLLNHFTSIRRGKGAIFDLNVVKPKK